MLAKIAFHKFVFGVALAAGWLLTQTEAESASVWKVSGPNGGTLFLGGSVHALATTDYPLPAEYSRAFDASARVVFEIDPKEIGGLHKSFLKEGEYPKDDSLKNHVDPRTYDYLRRFFGVLKVPEEKFAKLRPWYLALMLQAPQLHGLSTDLGVEGFLIKRARVHSKPMSGLESLSDSIKRYSGLTDRQSEEILLLTFIPADYGSAAKLKEAWRRGNADTVWQIASQIFRDVPSIAEREITSRNHNWIPKIERFLQSGKTYFVVAGVGHMGGPDGVLNLLRQRGCKTEQL